MNETDLFIQLTSLEDSPITICVKHIAAIYPNGDNTMILLPSGEKLEVKEAYSVVFSILPNTASIEECL